MYESYVEAWERFHHVRIVFGSIVRFMMQPEARSILLL